MQDFFQIRARGSTVGRGLRGAVATSLTMAYILFVNPDILCKATGADASMFTAFMVSTAAAAGVCCTLMRVIANFPPALASGMDLNAIVAFRSSAGARSTMTRTRRRRWSCARTSSTCPSPAGWLHLPWSYRSPLRDGVGGEEETASRPRHRRTPLNPELR